MDITDLQKDILKEIGNVGIGNAATALSNMINKEVKIALPSLEIIPLEQFLSNESENILVSICKISGELLGSIVICFNKETAFPLVDMMMMQEVGVTKKIDDMTVSAFKELINVIGGAYLDSLSSMFNFRLMPMPPSFAYGKIISIRDGIIKDLPEGSSEVMSVKTKFMINNDIIFGDFFIVLNNESLKQILDSIDNVFVD
jgi:chemotaxis protein CheC